MPGITTSVSSRSIARRVARGRRAAPRAASLASSTLVAVGLEHQPHELAHARRRPRRPGSSRCRGGRSRRRRRLRARAPRRPRGRQVDLERRAAARLAVDPDAAAALLDDAEHGREPEAGALAGLLGGEERLEQMRARTSASMPMPVSLTASSTCGPAAPSPCLATCAASSSTLPVSIVSAPPSGIASRALTARFTITCSICARSASTCASRSASSTRDSSTSSPMQPPQHAPPCSSTICVEVEHARAAAPAGG